MSEDHLEAERKYRAPALEKGLDVLELLAARGEPMTPSQMSVALGRSVSELFRMIQVLEFRGYIEQSGGTYSLSNRLFTLGLARAPTRTLTELALPQMKALAQDVTQSCHLVVPTDDQIVVIARVEAPGDLGYSVRVGYRRNLIEATSGLLFYGLAGPVARAALHARLEAAFGVQRVRRFAAAAAAAGAAGHAVRPSDFVRGVTDLAAPILGPDGIEATLIIPYIDRTPPTPPAEAVLQRMLEVTAALSDDLGAPPIAPRPRSQPA
jgi:DNA-binding IclR family transcriptional regulator